jgi:hypothetical protein
MSTLQALQSLENQLLAQLEALLTNLTAIRKAKELLQTNEAAQDRRLDVTALHKIAEEKKSSLKDLANSAADFLRHIDNEPVQIKEIKNYVQDHNLVIPGSNPGATLAAVLRGDGRFILVDRQKKLWMLKSTEENTHQG